MRILLIGNFAPPYEEENLHNFTLLNYLKNEGHECRVINIADSHPKNKEIINIKSYFNFVIKLIRYGFRCKIIHFLTKGYVRPGLMKLLTTAVIGKLLRTKIIITLHSEMFSILGQLRSKLGGRQLLRLSFSLADKVICGDKHNYEAAITHSGTEDKFDIIPSFFCIPEDLNEKELSPLSKLGNKKKIIVFANINYPSFLFEILNNLLSGFLTSDTGIIISLSEKLSAKLQHVIEETGKRLAGNLVFIDYDNIQMLSLAYAKADIFLRPLTCDGKMFFPGFTAFLKKPARSENCLYFPKSLMLVKEGDITGLCAFIINDVLSMKDDEPLQAAPPEDFYAKLKEIYLK